MRVARAPLVLAPVALLCAAAIGLGLVRPAPPARAVEARPPPAAQDPSRPVAGAPAVFPGPYEARLVAVVDGDTFRARLGVWFGQEVETLVRLRRVDAPELAARCPSEARQAAAARAALAEMLGSGRIVLSQVGGDKYFGRIVADVAVVSPEGVFPDVDVGAALEAAGLARPYSGRRRESWCDLASR
ncbi:MAG: nuclease [Rhizobiales bacterium]|nr:nuclease [Hyphomicrobiales bacterium]